MAEETHGPSAPIRADEASSALPRKKGKSKDKKGKKDKKPDDWDTNKTDAGARERVNPQFVRYYQSQLAPLLSGEDDWELLDAKLRVPLPITFRFSGSPEDAEPSVLARYRSLARSSA